MSEQPPFELDAEAAKVLEALWESGHSAFVVGGAVRDALLGIPSADWDIATDAEPERLLEIFPAGTYQNRFGTVRVGKLEVTTFRRDHHYADHRRPERVTFTDDIFEDLARRDLTINAIAWGRRPTGGAARLLDPADGLSDLRARVVRAVGDPGSRFDEDALRLLRAVRIAAHLGFEIETRTLIAMRAHAADIEWVSEERVAAEIRRMLASATPSRALRLLRDTGLASVALPELAGISDEAHVEAVVDTVAAGPRDTEAMRLAAVVHSLDVDEARAALARLRVNERQADRALRLARHTHAVEGEAGDDVGLRRLMQHLGRDAIDELLELRRAHAQAVGGVRGRDAAGSADATDELGRRIEAQRAAAVPLTLADLPIDGLDLRTELEIEEGPLVGEILAALLEEVIVDPGRSQREVLVDAARRIAAESPRASSRVGSAE
jgi:tRNA nucleotidyltransferase (CCA-adding enzyme)